MNEATKYSNNYRVVSGTFTVKANDTILACDTSTVATTMTLNGISANSWNTAWALFVFDYSNNAATNSITIVAGSGQTINGASSVTFSTNGCYIKIFIANNTSYLAFSSTIGAGALTQAYTTIYDEGSVLTQRFRLNFIGAAVTATDDAGNARTDVTINAITSAYTTILDEGISLTQRTKLNFIGSNVTAVDDPSGNKTDVTITGGSDSLYVKKALTAADVLAPVSSGTRSIVSGTKITEWDTKVEDGVTGFVLLNGVWTVASDGYFEINTRLVTRINATDVDNNDDGSGNKWMTGATDVGFMAIGVVLTKVTSGQVEVICSNKQTVTQNVSDINVDTTCGMYSLTAGDTLSVYLLNKTNWNVTGFANSTSLPDCGFEFSAVKIR